MNIARWTYLFMTTVGLGIGASLVIGLYILFVDPDSAPFQLGLGGVGYNLIGTAIVGALLGAFSHMGFFAYLTVNYFAQGFFRSKLLWIYIQVFLIIVVFVYSGVLRMREGESFLPYMTLPLIVALVAIPVTWLKVKQTNRTSAVPTLFFMIAVTLLEAVPALRQYNPYATALMVGPLIVCNAWQILQLHKLLKPAVKNE